jgi:intracellular protease, PfpI family
MQKRVAILTENGFEQIELISPKETLEDAGMKVDIISPQKDKVKGWNHTDWGIELDVDKHIDQANDLDYDALILPGGVINPDKLRMNDSAIKFVKGFMQSGKPVAAICHGPQTLIETGLVKGKTMTSYPSVKTDLENAGANWQDKEVIVDNNLITSRNPDDLPAFNQALITALQH